jgi:DNA-binding LytR/AlgR family response regulator
MNILIIEDEPHAAKLLESLLREFLPGSTVVGRIDTVKKAVQYFQQNAPPDLVMMDIQLADGISFNIFDQCEVKSPVIFTTAYDEYALKAFKVNSIDYILKPIDKEELRQSLEKFRNLRGSSTAPNVDFHGNLQEVMRMLTKKYKSRFMIKVGEHLRTVEVSSILYFVSQEKTTFCCTTDNRRMILDHTLEELEEVIDPEMFFRINRKYMVSAAAISDIVQFTNSRLKLNLKNCSDQDVVVAREKVQEFKAWLDR